MKKAAQDRKARRWRGTRRAKQPRLANPWALGRQLRPRLEQLEDRRLLAPLIDVGDHLLSPNLADQDILINVSSDPEEQVQGLNFFVQVADGGPEVPGGSIDAPIIQLLDVLTGTIFASNNVGKTDFDGGPPPYPDDYPQFEGHSTLTSSGTVPANGLLGIVTIDTAGFTGGTFDLFMENTLNGPTNFIIGAGITDGTITVSTKPTAVPGTGYAVPEEGSLVLDGSDSSDPEESFVFGGRTLTLDGIVTHLWDLDGDAIFGETGADAQRGDETGPSPTFSAAGLDGASVFQVGLKVVDTTGLISDVVTGNIQINNVAPTVNAPTDAAVNEGSPFTGSGRFADPGAETWTASVDYRDGSGVQPLTLNPDKTFDLSHTYADNGAYTVIVTVADDDAGIGSDTLLVTVNNVAPTILLTAADTVGEGADYTLTLGTITDPGEDTVTQWTVNWGDGLSDTYGSGGDRTHLYEGNGTYTVAVDLADEDGTHAGAGSLDLTVNPAEPEVTDLGPIDFPLLEHLSLADGSLYYRVETVHDGVFTLQVDAATPPESARLKLYGADPVETIGLTPLAESAPDEDGNQRIDWAVASGETYYVEVHGDGTDFDVRFANLLHHDASNGILTVHGTDGDDTFEFNAGSSRDVTVNGVRYHFDDAQVKSVTFDGGDGDDTVILDDSVGDDTLTAGATHAVFTNSDQTPGFTVTVDGFEELQAYARSGGTDKAFLHDSDAKDKFKSEPAENYAKMYGGRMYNRVKFYDVVEAFSSGEKDLARLFGTEGNDVFVGRQDVSWLRTDVFDVGVHNFRQVIAYGNEGGNDEATLKDSALKDEVHLKGHKSEIFDQQTNGEIYKITARRFDTVHADGSEGAGDDKVKIWETARKNHVAAADNWARVYAKNTQMEMIYYVLAFEFVKVRASTGGTDTANVTEPLSFDLVFEDGWGQ